MSTIEFISHGRAGTSPARPRICIIALSAIADDPRVRRQGDAFALAGWEVIAVGLRGAQSTRPDWTILTYSEPELIPVEEPISSDAGTLVSEATYPSAVSESMTESLPLPEVTAPFPSLQVVAAAASSKVRGGLDADVIVEMVSPAAAANDKPPNLPRSSAETGSNRCAAIDRWMPWQASMRHRFVGTLYSIYHRLLTARIKTVARLYGIYYNLLTWRIRIVQKFYQKYYQLLNLREKFVQTCYRQYYYLCNFRRRIIGKMYFAHYRARAKRVEMLAKLVPAGKLGYASKLMWVRVRPNTAEDLYWTLQSTINELHEVAQTVDADVWLANDWNVLPIAARMAKEKGGSYVYDSHEFAAEEYAEKWKWRLWNKPLICALERRFIRNASVVSAVSAGIAQRLDAMYRLPRASMVIRNTPLYQSSRFRPTGKRIRVLYHGIVVIGRGLEAAIDSVALWRPEFDLTIRGPDNPGYSNELRQRIRNAGLQDRVRLAPPVPMTALVTEAADFDIGFFALPGHSRHNEFALPNKFFEYVMAGLALCVSDLPEMAGLVHQYQLGVLIPRLDPQLIAKAINELDRERIDGYKRNALAAAEQLCWERESARMVAAYRQLVPERLLG